VDTQEVVVLVGGVLVVGFIIWYFFMSEGTQGRAAAAEGVQRINITVKGGYTPDVVVVKRGIPVEISFYRDEASTCTDQVIFGDFQISRALPAFETTVVRLTPERAGEFRFNCGMNMVRGRLVVED
jgi:plastocyanin domain-containing protein